MNIDITKKYTTRGGLPVRIYAVDGEGQYQVHGAIQQKDGWQGETWTIDGAFTLGSGSRARDLTPARAWRAWKLGDEMPRFIMTKLKPACTGNGAIYALQPASFSDIQLEVIFMDRIWVHEDGSETPCGAETP